MSVRKGRRQCTHTSSNDDNTYHPAGPETNISSCIRPFCENVGHRVRECRSLFIDLMKFDDSLDRWPPVMTKVRCEEYLFFALSRFRLDIIQITVLYYNVRINKIQGKDKRRFNNGCSKHAKKLSAAQICRKILCDEVSYKS